MFSNCLFHRHIILLYIIYLIDAHIQIPVPDSQTLFLHFVSARGSQGAMDRFCILLTDVNDWPYSDG